MKKTTTFLTFVGDQCGKAEEAINFYTSLFPNSEIRSLEKYPEGEAGGTPALIKHGVFTINTTEYMVSESNFEHAFTFSPAISIFIECDSEDEMDTFFEKLSKGGQIMVPLDDYGFSNSRKYGWCADKYGVSWQLNIA
jgi:predicted 3-demethylubiquinone-9 3-methyltransferase (glyoxalase superfamily)